MTPTVLYNGEPASGVPVDARGLHYGDGVFRTVLAWDSELLDWQRHLATLARDCAALELESPAAALLTAEASELAAGRPRSVIKLIVMRRAGDRGYRTDTRSVDRLLLRYETPHYDAACWDQGIVAFRCSQTLAAQPALAGIKHLNRLEQVLASRNWPGQPGQPGYAHEGLLCDHHGHVIGGTRSNLFWVRAGTLYTPDLSDCGVAGMMREKILARCAQLGLTAKIQATDWTDLMNAEEIFVTNALIGLWPVRELESHIYAAPGAVTARLMQLLNHPRTI